MSKVLIISGPSGVGKTTLSKFIAAYSNYEHIEGEKIRKANFGTSVYTDREKNAEFHELLIKEIDKRIAAHKDIIIEYIFDESNLELLIKHFETTNVCFEIKILLPKIGITIDRDRQRGYWTTGEKYITELHSLFEKLKSKAKFHNFFIDTSNETVNETFENHFRHLIEIQKPKEMHNMGHS